MTGDYDTADEIDVVCRGIEAVSANNAAGLDGRETTVAADTKTVVTTGANSGLGLATAVEVARRGLRSVGTVRSEAKAQIVHETAARAGVEVETMILDVTDAEGCEQVIDKTRPFAVVNNAGFTANGAIEDVSDEEARRALETMVLAPMRLARLAVPHMRARHQGRIVMLSSIYGRITTPLTGWYQGAKHALEALSDALRMEVASAGIKVVLIEPGAFNTGIWDVFEREVERHGGSEYENAYRRTVQGARLAQPLRGEPAQAAKAIADAVTRRRPRPRYLVGYDAQTIALLDRLTPTPLKDRLSRTVLGL